MAKKEFMKIQKILQELFEERGISLAKIVLFGSYAKDEERPDSDIDLIIVSKDFRGKNIFEIAKLVSGVNRELVNITRKPFDILYYSDQEWKAGRGLVLSAAKKEGKVIFG